MPCRACEDCTLDIVQTAVVQCTCRLVAGDEPRARKCYQRALALQPGQRQAGEALCGLLERQLAGDQVAAVQIALCKELVEKDPAADWAWRRLARMQLDSEDHEGAVVSWGTMLASYETS